MSVVDEVFALLEPVVRPVLHPDDAFVVTHLVEGGEKLEAVVILARTAARRSVPIVPGDLSSLQDLVRDLPEDRRGDVRRVRDSLRGLVVA